MHPTTARDAAQGSADFPDLIVDRWREGGSRRSFVAVTSALVPAVARAVEPTAGPNSEPVAEPVVGPAAEPGQGPDTERVVGHCPAVDNTVHPGSRVMLLEVSPDMRGQGVEDALLRAQVDASNGSLRMKIYEHQVDDQQLAARFGGIAVQVTPPWRYVVGPEMRAWAAQHAPVEKAAIGRALPEETEDLLALEVDHYIDQHASWSPTAPRETLLAELGEDHDPGSPSTWDRDRSRVLRRGGRLVAAALVWPSDDDEGDGEGDREVSLLSRPYVGPTSRADKEACLAALIETSADGDQLLIDSHLTMREEWAMMREVPGLVPSDGTGWMAITAIPVPGGPAPVPVPRELVPTETPWVHALLP